MGYEAECTKGVSLPATSSLMPRLMRSLCPLCGPLPWPSACVIPRLLGAALSHALIPSLLSQS